MAIAYYADENFNKRITKGLRSRGVDVMTAEDDGHRQTDDDIVLDRATALDRVAVSQDKDFLRMAHAYQASGKQFAGVIYAAQVGMHVGRYLQQLYDLAMAGNPGDLCNDVVYLK